MQSDGLHDRGHSHTVGADGLQHPGLRHGLVLRAAQGGVDAGPLCHGARRLGKLGVPDPAHIDEDRTGQGRGSGEVEVIDDGHDLADPPAAQATTGIDQDGATHAGSGRDTCQGDHRPGAVPLVEVGASLGHEHAPFC